MLKKNKFGGLNDGFIKVYKVDNIGNPGEMPVEGLVYKLSIRYEEKTIGVQRETLAMQEGFKIEKLIECLKNDDVKTNDVVIFFDNSQHEIKKIQYLQDAPKRMLISLEALGVDFNV